MSNKGLLAFSTVFIFLCSYSIASETPTERGLKEAEARLAEQQFAEQYRRQHQAQNQIQQSEYDGPMEEVYTQGQRPTTPSTYYPNIGDIVGPSQSGPRSPQGSASSAQPNNVNDNSRESTKNKICKAEAKKAFNTCYVDRMENTNIVISACSVAEYAFGRSESCRLQNERWKESTILICNNIELDYYIYNCPGAL